MAVKAGFLPPLKDRGRFSNSGQVFYDNQGTKSTSNRHVFEATALKFIHIVVYPHR